MKVFYDPDDELLPSILQSVIWSYKQYIDNKLNQIGIPEEVAGLLDVKKVIREVIDPALKDPMAGNQFKIICNDDAVRDLLVGMLIHYLVETKEIIRTIKDAKIMARCMRDNDVIEDQILSAIYVRNKYSV